MIARFALTLPAVVLAATLAGCRPYDTPESAEIAPHETAFLVPLEGDTRRQEMFPSQEYLQQNKVAVKRVQITHRWSQQGRMWWDGRWEDTVKLVKVDRSPVTREWTAAAGTGTSARDQAVRAESHDHIAFSLGFICTACVEERDAARFLYRYHGDSLADTMESEVRARIQTDVADMATRYDLEYLRLNKAEIMELLRFDLSAFFGQRGITITTLGMVGGLQYEHAEIDNGSTE